MARLVLHVDAGREWRGGQQQALSLMCRLPRFGYDAALAAPPKSPLAAAATDHGIGVRAIGMRSDWDLFSARSLRATVQQLRPALIHFHDARGAGVGALIARAALPPVVIARRVDFPIGRTWLSRRKYTRAARIIAVSHRVQEVCVAGGLPAERIAVVHDGVDLGRFAQRREPEDARHAMRLPSRCELIGVVAALVDHKGHRYLIDALPSILASRPTTKVVLAGEGPLRRSLGEQAADLRVGHAVTFLGQVPDIPAFLSAIDLFVLPSHLEGLCQALIEAMAAGVPVVATLAGGIPEVVEQEVSGLLVPQRDPAALAQAVLRVLGDAELRRRLSDGARVQAGRFGVEQMVESTARVYDQLLPAQ